MVCERVFLKERFPFLGEEGRDPFVDTYLPYNLAEMHRENQKRPCLIVCPGGGYGMCSQREWEPIALPFAADGYNVFVLRYSVAPHRFPTQLREVAAVLELIAENRDEWHCDTEKVAIMGFSAGGHLAAHYSVRYDCDAVRAVFPESKPVHASVLCYPVISAAFPECHRGSFENLLGQFPTRREDVEFFSCEYGVTDQTPPAFLWHCADDTCVPVKNSLAYAAALSAKGVPFELHVYPTGGHGISTCDDQTLNEVQEYHRVASHWIPDAKRWLRGVLGR